MEYNKEDDKDTDMLVEKSQENIQPHDPKPEELS
jgi:hypothetical protein